MNKTQNRIASITILNLCLISLVFLSLAFAGCDAKSLGEKFGGGVIDFSSGLENGAKTAENANSKTNTENELCRVQDAFTKAGLRFTSFDASAGTTKVYVLSQNAVKGHLMLKAFDASDNEIARGKQKIDFDKDDAHEILFKLEGNISNLKYYTMDFVAE